MLLRQHVNTSVQRYSRSLGLLPMMVLHHDLRLEVTPRDKWLDKVRARLSPKQQGLPRHDHVLTIDLVSPTMAYVKLKCAIPPRFFTDQLSLLKIDGRWQVAQKVFTTEMRE
jgi:hypothetical protein